MVTSRSNWKRTGRIPSAGNLKVPWILRSSEQMVGYVGYEDMHLLPYSSMSKTFVRGSICCLVLSTLASCSLDNMPVTPLETSDQISQSAVYTSLDKSTLSDEIKQMLNDAFPYNSPLVATDHSKIVVGGDMIILLDDLLLDHPKDASIHDEGDVKVYNRHRRNDLGTNYLIKNTILTTPCLLVGIQRTDLEIAGFYGAQRNEIEYALEDAFDLWHDVPNSNVCFDYQIVTDQHGSDVDVLVRFLDNVPNTTGTGTRNGVTIAPGSDGIPNVNTYLVDDRPYTGTMFISTARLQDSKKFWAELQQGPSYAGNVFHTMVHEAGHVLGFKHTEDDSSPSNPVICGTQESPSTSIMYTKEYATRNSRGRVFSSADAEAAQVTFPHTNNQVLFTLQAVNDQPEGFLLVDISNQGQKYANVRIQIFDVNTNSMRLDQTRCWANATSNPLVYPVPNNRDYEVTVYGYNARLDDLTPANMRDDDTY